MLHKISRSVRRRLSLLALTGFLTASCGEAPTASSTRDASAIHPAASASDSRTEDAENLGPSVIQDPAAQDSTAVIGRGVLIGSGH
jgi:hypothetical protein